MTLDETERLLKVLRTNGVSHFKSFEFEVKFADHPSSNELATTASEPNAYVHPSSAPAELPSQDSAGVTFSDVPAVVDAKIPHRIHEVMGMLRMNDEQLVDKLFPAEDDNLQVPQMNFGEQ